MEFTGLRRVRVFSVPRVVLFLPVGSFFSKIRLVFQFLGWCSPHPRCFLLPPPLFSSRVFATMVLSFVHCDDARRAEMNVDEVR